MSRLLVRTLLGSCRPAGAASWNVARRALRPLRTPLYVPPMARRAGTVATDLKVMESLQVTTKPDLHRSVEAFAKTMNQFLSVVKDVKQTEEKAVFVLDKKYVESFRSLAPPFGYNGLGEFVYYRTYSRIKPNGKNEEWYETVERVVNGTYTMLKRWCLRRGIHWTEAKGQKGAKIMYRLIWEMKFLPPGRGLWAMGSPLTTERENYAALNNCAFVSTEGIDKDPYRPFEFLMDASMLGVGVGFDTKGVGKLHVKGPNYTLPTETYVIPDTREGWVESVRLLLASIFENTAPVAFDYSKIRPAGTPIVGFGGVASGPGVLQELHDDLLRLMQLDIYSWQLARMNEHQEFEGDAWKEMHRSLHTICDDLHRLRMTGIRARELQQSLNQMEDEMKTKYGRHNRSFPTEEAILKGKIQGTKSELASEAGRRRLILNSIHEQEGRLRVLSRLVQPLYENQTWTGPPINTDNIVSIMNMIGKCVVAGNVRRTAEIAFGDPTSPEFEQFIHLKNYQKNPHRMEYGWTSNNSIFAQLGMDYSPFAKLIQTNGEPGFAWLDNMRNFSRMNGVPDYKDRRVAGGNPCLTADTMVFTDRGLQPIRDLVGRPFVAIVNGKKCPSTAKGFWKTGEKHVKKIILKSGLHVEATKNHKFQKADSKWTEVKDLKVGDKLKICDNDQNGFDFQWKGPGTYEEGYFCGYLIGDGTFADDIGILDVWIPEGDVIANQPHAKALEDWARGLAHRSDWKGWRLSHTQNGQCKYRMSMKAFGFIAKKFGIKPNIKTVYESGSSQFSKGIIQGLFDTDGTVQVAKGQRFSVRLNQSNLGRLQAVQRLLLCFGIQSQIYQQRRKEQIRRLPDGKGGLKYYPTQANHELVLSGRDIVSFHERIGFRRQSKAEKLGMLIGSYTRGPYGKSFNDVIVSIESSPGKVAVYDATVPGPNSFSANGIKAHNCLEQSLESYELCCLVETFPSRHATKEEFFTTLKYAYLYAKIVTLGHTPWAETNRVMIRNHRIGTSVTGIAQFLGIRTLEELRTWLDEGYNVINSDQDGHDVVYSEWLGVPRSKKTTSVKPSGTVSILAGATPGLHYPESRFYIRRVRLGKNDALVPMLTSQGVTVEPALDAPNDTVVAEFPVDCGKGVRTLDEVSMREQLDLCAFMQRWWADNQVSATITFDADKEGPQIPGALNFYQYHLKGVSFLPRLKKGAYAQMPYEAISEATYRQRLERLHLPIRFSVSGHQATPERGCNNDTCSL